MTSCFQSNHSFCPLTFTLKHSFVCSHMFSCWFWRKLISIESILPCLISGQIGILFIKLTIFSRASANERVWGGSVSCSRTLTRLLMDTHGLLHRLLPVLFWTWKTFYLTAATSWVMWLMWHSGGKLTWQKTRLDYVPSGNHASITHDKNCIFIQGIWSEKTCLFF